MAKFTTPELRLQAYKEFAEALTDGLPYKRGLYGCVWLWRWMQGYIPEFQRWVNDIDKYSCGITEDTVCEEFPEFAAYKPVDQEFMYSSWFGDNRERLTAVLNCINLLLTSKTEADGTD